MGTIEFTDRRSGKKAATDFCEPHLNLLAHAQALEISIGSRCGGHGVCGGDIVRPWVLVEGLSPDQVTQALSPVTEAEKRLLTPEQIDEGYRLACQCYPNNKDLSLRVESVIS